LADVSTNQGLTCHSTPNTLQTRQTKYEQTPQKISTIPLVPHPPCALEINVDTELYGLHNNSPLFQSVSYPDMFRPLHVIIFRHFVQNYIQDTQTYDARHFPRKANSDIQSFCMDQQYNSSTSKLHLCTRKILHV
jgi:hypothetical protein